MFNFVKSFFCLNDVNLVSNLVTKNLKIRYRGSLLGLLWTVLIPGFSSLIYFIIFKFILKVQIDHYLLFIVAGLIPWTFFSHTLTAGLETLVANQSLLNKVPMEPKALVLSETLTYFLNFVLSLPILFAVLIFERLGFSVHLFQLVILFLLLFIMAYSLSLMLSLAYVYFRDLKFMLSLLLQFWFYLTPIMYSKSMIPDRFHYLLYLNPVGTLFVGIHESLIFQKTVPVEYYASSFLWTGFLLASSVLCIKLFEGEIVESL